MYRPESAASAHPAWGLPPTTPARRISRNVWALGFTSLLTDVSSEMVTAVLPLYLVAYYGMSPLAFGAIDGLQQGVSALVRWVGGAAADWRGRYKETAAIGYAVSAVTRLGWLGIGGG